MSMAHRIALVSTRRRERARLAAWKVARERAAIQQAATPRAHESLDGEPVVPAQGDLICFMVAIRPC
jgi:hypothetical protein